MKKYLKYFLLLIILINILTINIYAQDNTNNSPNNDKIYITYKNVLEKQINKILQQASISKNDIVLLKALSYINLADNDRLLLLDNYYEKLGDSRLQNMQAALEAEIDNGYDHTYKNAIELNIGSFLAQEETTDKDIVYIQDINKINNDNKKNSDKISSLKKLQAQYTAEDDMVYKNSIEAIIKALENELPTPPDVSELPVKTLIIGEYIIYMPSLTTDNLISAKNTMSDNGKMYYKSEFINGKWIEMNNISELYQLMIADKLKIVEDESIFKNIEYMAQIDKDGNLIEYREFKRYCDELSKNTSQAKKEASKSDDENKSSDDDNKSGDDKSSDSSSDDEFSSDLNKQIQKLQKDYLADSLSGMLAESKTLAAKLRDVKALYDENKDARLERLISSLENEVNNNSDKYDNSIKKLIDSLLDGSSLSDGDKQLANDLDAINGISQSTKEERELKQQLVKAQNQNNKATENTIKLLLGMEVVDNTVDLQKTADDLRSKGLTNLATSVQGQSFSKKEITTVKPFDEQLNNLMAATILLSDKKAEAMKKLTDKDILKAIDDNSSKNKSLLENMKTASLSTISSQSKKNASEKEALTKKLKDLNNSKNEVINKLADALNKNDNKTATDLYNKANSIQKSINDINNQIKQNDNQIKSMCDKLDNLSNTLGINDLVAIQECFDEIEEENEDFLIQIVELMIKRYILIEKYKVEKNRGQSVSMDRLRNEISIRDYQINYILSLKILDEEQVDIEYNIRLAQLLKDKKLEADYMAKKNSYNSKIQNKEKINADIMKKAKAVLNIK